MFQLEKILSVTIQNDFFKTSILLLSIRSEVEFCLFAFGLNDIFCLGNILFSVQQKASTVLLLDEPKIRGSLVFWKRQRIKKEIIFFLHMLIDGPFTSASASIFSSFPAALHHSFVKKTEQTR